MSIAEESNNEISVGNEITPAIVSRGESARDNHPWDTQLPELVDKLKAKEIAVSDVPREILQKCALYMKRHGESNLSIARVLDVDPRTVSRYLKIIREQESLTLGPNFQKSIVGECVNNWRASCQRLLMLSYSSDLTPLEQMKAIFVYHQVLKDGLELLEKLGYLSKKTGEADMSAAVSADEKKKEKLKYKKLDPEILNDIDKIGPMGREQIRRKLEKKVFGLE
jgi:hypothetical protein